MRKDPGPKPPSRLRDNKGKREYRTPVGWVDRSAANKRWMAIEQLRTKFGYSIDDEIDWDEWTEVKTFIDADTEQKVVSDRIEINTSVPLSVEEIVQMQEHYRRYGPLSGRDRVLPDPYQPMPEVVLPE